MSEFKDFICNSAVEKMRTITYGNLSIVSLGEGENRFVDICDKNERILCRMLIDTSACEVCAIRRVIITSLIPVHEWLKETCNEYEDKKYEYHTWENVDKLMWKLVDYIRHNG